MKKLLSPVVLMSLMLNLGVLNVQAMNNVDNGDDQKDELASEYDNLDSTDLLEQLAQAHLDENREVDEIQKIEQKTLIALEHEVAHYIEKLPEELQKLLPDWDTTFEKFKNKIELLKKPYRNFIKEYKDIARYLPENKNSVFNSLFVQTSLGLKPFSLQDGLNEKKGITDEYNKNMHLIYEKIINEKYHNDLVAYEKGRVGHFTKRLICTDPMIPFDFIVKSYEYDDKKIKISEEFKNLISKGFKKNYHDIITYTWGTDKKASTGDDEALILGYAPRIFTMHTNRLAFIWGNSDGEDLTLQEKKLLHRSPLLHDHAYAFKSLFIPGIISIFERTTQVKLSEMLYFYAWLSLVGSKNVFIYLGSLVNIHSPQEKETPEDYKPFTKVIENHSKATNKDFLALAHHVLKQAQKIKEKKD